MNRQQLRNTLIVLAMGTVLFVWILSRINREPSEADVEATAEATAEELDATPVHGPFFDDVDVDGAMTRATRGTGDRYHPDMASRLRVEPAGKDSHGDSLYEITTSHGHHPVCLAVHTPDYPWNRYPLDFEQDEDPSFPTTEVTYGPCRPG